MKAKAKDDKIKQKYFTIAYSTLIPFIIVVVIPFVATFVDPRAFT